MIFFIILGIIVSVASLLDYYLIDPITTTQIIAICTFDFALLFLNSYLFLGFENYRFLKSLGASFGYILSFFLIAYLTLDTFLTFSIMCDIFFDILFYAFATGPCLIFMIPLLIILFFNLE